MTRKTAEAYRAVFKCIEERLFELKPAEFMTDYEEGMRSAIKKHWPNVVIRGCLFHFDRAIQRKCNSFGLMRTLKKNFNARKIRGMLMSIPLLAANQIEEGYGHIRKFALRKKLNDRFGSVIYFLILRDIG